METETRSLFSTHQAPHELAQPEVAMTARCAPTCTATPSSWSFSRRWSRRVCDSRLSANKRWLRSARCCTLYRCRTRACVRDMLGFDVKASIVQRPNAYFWRPALCTTWSASETRAICAALRSGCAGASCRSCRCAPTCLSRTTFS